MGPKAPRRSARGRHAGVLRGAAGARPVVGRDFTAEEDLPSGPRVAIIRDGLWREWFAARPDILGRTIEVGGFAREIVGVAPPGFDFPRDARVWLPARNDDEACGRACVYLDGIARLRDGVSVDAARQEMAAIARRVEAAYPGDNAGVTVGLSTLRDVMSVFSFRRTDRPPPPAGRAPDALYRVVDPEYFATLGIPIVAGRRFAPFDREGSVPVIVISRRMAEEFWGARTRSAGRLALDNGSPVRTIVGVVADVRSSSLTAPPAPEMYMPHAQDGARAVTFVLRSRLPVGDVPAAARLAVQGIDPRLPLFHPAAMQDLLDNASTRTRFYLLLLALFAGLAVVLASVGIYGVVGYVARSGVARSAFASPSAPGARKSSARSRGRA